MNAASVAFVGSDERQRLIDDVIDPAFARTGEPSWSTSDRLIGLQQRPRAHLSGGGRLTDRRRLVGCVGLAHVARAVVQRRDAGLRVEAEGRLPTGAPWRSRGAASR